MSDEKKFWETINERLYVSEKKIAELKELANINKDNIIVWLKADKDAITEIEELKEQVKYLNDRYKESGGLQCLRDRGLIKDVLRELLEKMWSWYAIEKPTSYDRQCYSKSLKHTLQKLMGEKE